MMTKNQYKFLKILYKYKNTPNLKSHFICQKLHLKKDNTFYNSILSYIDFNSEVPTDFDDTFTILGHNTGNPDDDAVFCITSKGETFVESQKNNTNKWIIETLIAIVAILVSIIIA